MRIRRLKFGIDWWYQLVPEKAFSPLICIRWPGWMPASTRPFAFEMQHFAISTTFLGKKNFHQFLLWPTSRRQRFCPKFKAWTASSAERLTQIQSTLIQCLLGAGRILIQINLTFAYLRPQSIFMWPSWSQPMAFNTRSPSEMRGDSPQERFLLGLW